MRSRQAVRRPVAPAARADLRNVRCFEEELVARVKRGLPGGEALEEARARLAGPGGD